MPRHKNTDSQVAQNAIAASTLASMGVGIPILSALSSTKGHSKFNKNVMGHKVEFNAPESSLHGPHYNPSNNRIHSWATSRDLGALEHGVASHEIGHAITDAHAPALGKILMGNRIVAVGGAPLIGLGLVSSAKNEKQAKKRWLLSSIPGAVLTAEEAAASGIGAIKTLQHHGVGKALKSGPLAFIGVPTYAMGTLAPGAFAYHYKKKQLHGRKRNTKTSAR